MTPKFRAWHKELGRMMLIEIMYFFFFGNELEELELNDPVMNDHISVYPDDIILMQSTGLKDKNGKEIFEGDVVSIDTDEFDLLFVKYESCIYWLMDDEECVEHLSDYYKYVSIVGNIYENPELLEVGK